MPLPFLSLLETAVFESNRSSLAHVEFVDDAIGVKPIERLTGRLKNVKFNSQYFGYTGLTFLRGYTKAD